MFLRDNIHRRASICWAISVKKDINRCSVERVFFVISYGGKAEEISESGHGDYISKQIYNYQIALLQDSPSPPGRIQILDFLVNEQKRRPPNAVDPIRMRQCGVLRWMVEESLVKLDSKAAVDANINCPKTRKLAVLGGGPLAKSVSTGTFLCFVCVEYDSIHALTWLVEDRSTPITDMVNGFNLLHVCAFFGRLEIMLWLFMRPEWKTLSSGFSTRKEFEMGSAVNIAIIRGHTHTADLLFTLGCSSQDGNGRSPDYFALTSSHAFVRAWGAEKAKPLRLEKDVDKLLCYVSNPIDYESLKRYITSSRCLDVER
jgi:hypothetical protein